MERKLVSIFVADFVGSTPEMAADEEAAIKRIGLALDPASGFVTNNHGRVFNTVGIGKALSACDVLPGLKPFRFAPGRANRNVPVLLATG